MSVHNRDAQTPATYLRPSLRSRGCGDQLVFGWSNVPGLPFAPLGISLVAISWILPVWAIMLFRREGTEVEPTSPTNRKLITSGPYQFTRNPMYLGLVILTLGIAIWVGAWPMFGAPIALFATANWVHIPFEEVKMRHAHQCLLSGAKRTSSRVSGMSVIDPYATSARRFCCNAQRRSYWGM
jgi:hypothetical protein